MACKLVVWVVALGNFCVNLLISCDRALDNTIAVVVVYNLVVVSGNLYVVAEADNQEDESLMKNMENILPKKIQKVLYVL